MSPEQVIGQTLGPTADIYSLGIILYQMLTAKMPIESNNVRQILAIKINQDLPPPSEKFPFIPKVLDSVVQKSLARDPRKRYQTGKELFDDFQKAAFEISLEYSQATQPVLDQGILSDVRRNYVETEVDQPFEEATTDTPVVIDNQSLPAVEEVSSKVPSPMYEANAATNEHLYSVPISSPKPLIDGSNRLVKMPTNNTLSSSPPPLKVTDANDRQVKFLIIMVGVLLVLLVIATALLFMQNK
jgi:serine/threonine protein kinase